MKAIVRADLRAKGERPPVEIDGKPGWLPVGLMGHQFPSFQPDELDAEEFNLVLLHRKIGVIRASSIDFDFS